MEVVSLAAPWGAEPPTRGKIDRAAASARDEVFAALTADAVLDSLPTPPTDAGAREALRSRWLSLNPAWSLPLPAPGRGLSAQRLAVAAAVGSLLGMMVLGGLLNLTLGLRALGMLIGGPGRRGGGHVRGRPAGREQGPAADAQGPAGRGLDGGPAGRRHPRARRLWGRLAGFGLLRRILVYAGVVSLLAFTRGSAQYDARAYRSAVRDLIRQCGRCSALLLCGLSAGPVSQPPRAGAWTRALARAIQDLHRCRRRGSADRRRGGAAGGAPAGAGGRLGAAALRAGRPRGAPAAALGSGAWRSTTGPSA